jgi:predicted amidohydrolase
MTELQVAAVQMNSGESKSENYAQADSLVRRAANDGAQLVVLPEYFNCLGDRRKMLAEAEPLDGATAQFLAGLARELRITLVGGTFCERSPDPTHAYNTSLTFDSSGTCIARYRKLHLFDVDLPGKLTYCESSWLAPGDDVVIRDLPIGDVQGNVGQEVNAGGDKNPTGGLTSPARLGAQAHAIRSALAICYDLRFPELFRLFADAGAELLVVPAAFTKATGRDHWELLCRARAVENQCFLIASNQTGKHAALETFGHSMIVDPWGVVLSSIDEGTGIAAATISRARLEEVRAQLPALKHRRSL